MTIKPKLREEHGGALIPVIIIVMVVLIMTMGIMEFSSLDARLANRDIETAQAFYLAESGLQRGRSWIDAQDTYPTDGIEPFGEEPETLDAGDYMVTIYADSVHSTPTRPAFTLRSTGTVDGRATIIETDLVPQSFADFLYYTDAEHEPGTGRCIWFCSFDHIDGPVHTNDQLNIMGDPAFDGEVTSAYGGPDDNNQNHDPSFQYYNGDRYNHIESADPSNPPFDEPTFGDGYSLGASAIELPNNLNEMKSVAQSGGIFISGNYEVEFAREDEATGDPMYGYVSYRKAGKRWNDVDLSGGGFNGVFYVNGGISSMSGVLDGRLTIVSNGNITISDNVTYYGSDGLNLDEGCDDMLGIVSGSSILIDNNEANQDDCIIHGHMIALSDFKADNYHTGSPRGTLSVRGGIVQQFRGPVGTGVLSGDDVIILTGYSKDYCYDWRLRDTPPPGYLLTGSYTQLGWRQVACD